MNFCIEAASGAGTNLKDVNILSYPPRWCLQQDQRETDALPSLFRPSCLILLNLSPSPAQLSPPSPLPPRLWLDFFVSNCGFKASSRNTSLSHAQPCWPIPFVEQVVLHSSPASQWGSWTSSIRVPPSLPRLLEPSLKADYTGEGGWP